MELHSWDLVPFWTVTQGSNRNANTNQCILRPQIGRQKVSGKRPRNGANCCALSTTSVGIFHMALQNVNDSLLQEVVLSDICLRAYNHEFNGNLWPLQQTAASSHLKP